jgi:uncharacterized protein (DUF305 family)
MKRSVAVAAAVVTVCAVVLGGSAAGGGAAGGAAGSGSGRVPAGYGVATGPDYNTVDVIFLQTLIPHHSQGVAIAALARSRPVRTDLKLMAAAIETTQKAEIDVMTGWLSAWRQPVAAAPDHKHGRAHGYAMWTPVADIDRLARSPDPQFERNFLNLLLDHQERAVRLARMETGDGKNPLVRDLAGRIDRSRSAQVELLSSYLGA